MVRNRNKLCVILPVFNSIDTRKIKVIVLKETALVILYCRSSFPKSWWEPEKLFLSETYGEDDTFVWKSAFSHTHFAKPVPKKAVLEIDLPCKAKMVEKSYVRSKGEAFLFVYSVEKMTT